MRYLLPAIIMVMLSSVIAPARTAVAGLSETFTNSATNTAVQAEIISERPSEEGEELAGNIIGQFVNAALGLLGVFFLVLMIYGGVLWMTSAGNEERVNKAKRLIVAAIIGLAIVLLSLVITIFVIDIFDVA